MPEETLCTVQIAERLHFENMISKRIGPKSVRGDFPVEDLTPEYEHYHGNTIEEDTDNAYEEGLPEDDNLELHPMLEAGDNSISAEVLIPLGGVLRWGKVISCKRELTATQLAGHMTGPSSIHGLMTLSLTMRP
jgi:hypothetical protein